MNRTPIAFYIGNIKCDTNNAMMREIAKLMKGYEYSLLRAQPNDWFCKLKIEVDAICNNHKRYVNIKLQMLERTSDGGYLIYAWKPNSEHSVLCITVSAVLNEIILKTEEK